MTTPERDDGFCPECGWTLLGCVCDSDLDDEDYDLCEHGFGLDEDCEECDEIEYEEFMARRGTLPP